MDAIDYKLWIGKKVKKKSGRDFKSTLRRNTVQNVIYLVLSQRKQRSVPCFVFEEDDTFVACSSCELVE